MSRSMKVLDAIANVLLLIGALNWGIIGVLQINVIAMIFGGNAAVISRIIYTLVGLSAVYVIAGVKAIKQRRCFMPA